MAARTHPDLIFAHAGNARVATSVIMIGMLAVLLGSTAMAIGLGSLPQPPAARGGADTSPASIRVIGTAPRAQASCDQQVWPNIEQRCLVRVDAKTVDTAVAKTPAIKRIETTPNVADTATAAAAPAAAPERKKLAPAPVPVAAVTPQVAAQAPADGGATRDLAPMPASSWTLHRLDPVEANTSGEQDAVNIDAGDIDAVNVQAFVDPSADASAGSGDGDEWASEPVEKPRKRKRKHRRHGHYFHLPFGGIRF